MGVLGAYLGSEGGKYIGKEGGKYLGKYLKLNDASTNAIASLGEESGKYVGALAGSAIPYFKKGGRVKKTGLAFLHSGEFVLRKDIKPTKSQKKKTKAKK